MRMMPELRLHA